MQQPTSSPERSGTAHATVIDEAREFLRATHQELGLPDDLAARWREVEAEIRRTGTWVQSERELRHGARVAWRNSNRCVGRLFWKALTVRDCRALDREDEVFEALVEHLVMAANDGNIRAVITVFAPADRDGHAQIRIWNAQLIRYAGYRQSDGTVLGDPANVAITEVAMALGWRPPSQGRFDVLPLVIQRGDQRPRLFELPSRAVLEVEISHPEHAWFRELGLRWHAVPAVSDMVLDCGGVRYPAAPFSGWYMGTEVGARNLSDESRYDVLPEIAQRMGLDLRRPRSLWRDRALVELNVAVLHSFEVAGVKMVDHHTATREFIEFARIEGTKGRSVNADWTWIVPPLSGSTTPVFHRHWQNDVVKPNYFYQAGADALRDAMADAVTGGPGDSTRCPMTGLRQGHARTSDD